MDPYDGFMFLKLRNKFHKTHEGSIIVGSKYNNLMIFILIDSAVLYLKLLIIYLYSYQWYISELQYTSLQFTRFLTANRMLKDMNPIYMQN